MTHPHEEWTKKRLEAYKGTTETLSLEFKSSRSLIWSTTEEKKEKKEKIQEAAMDVAGMANEQGGHIIYGIEEGKKGHQSQWREALGLDAGFGPEHGVSREWFLQVMRDHVHPPLDGLDAVDVRLDDDHRALVVLVPQARGVARQTDDLRFWRRDAQGRRKMSVQEIEDVRLRTVYPSLDLALVVEHLVAHNVHVKHLDLNIRFKIQNRSRATANFAVITIGLPAGSSAHWIREHEWDSLDPREPWKVGRYVCASGSSKRWSPITPGFSLVTEHFTISFDWQESDIFRPRAIGVARLDYDGGSKLYAIDSTHQDGDFRQWLRVNPMSTEQIEALVKHSGLPEEFTLSVSEP